MIKYSFLVYHKQYEDFLSQIRDIGVVHVIEKPFEETDSLKENKNQISLLTSTIANLKKRLGTGEEEGIIAKPFGPDSPNGFTLQQQYLDCQKRIEQNRVKLATLTKEMAQVEPWGEFDLSMLDALAQGDLHLRFFVVSKHRFSPEWETQYPIQIINEIAGQLYFIAIKQGETVIDIDAEEVRTPNVSLSKLRSDYQACVADNESIEKELDAIAEHVESIEEAKNNLFREINEERVKLSTQKEADNRLMLLEGWIPEEKSPLVSEYCEREGLLYIAEEPKENERVPILLKNNRFAKLFEPISKLYSLPTYGEIDLTAFLAPFFIIFFGFCLGDAGYGLTIFLLVTIYKMWKAKPELKPLLSMAQWLGLGTVLMGMVGGTVFGMNLLDTGYLLTAESMKFLAHGNMPKELIAKVGDIVGQHFATRDEYFAALTGAIGEDGLGKFKSLLMRASFSDYSFLNSFRHVLLDSQSMFNLAIIFGLFQILFGMGMKAANLIKQKGFVFSVSTFSWMILILGLVAFPGGAALGLFSSEAVKLPTYIVLGVSGVGILFFNDPSANIFVSFGKGLYDIYGMATGIFGDLLSYIRLFALGTSGAILGFVVDQIALQFLSIQYAGPIIFVIFLLFGHTLVLLLSALGAFVHPLRLTFVEFYKNSGFIGGGKAYKPFTN